MNCFSIRENRIAFLHGTFLSPSGYIRDITLERSKPEYMEAFGRFERDSITGKIRSLQRSIMHRKMLKAERAIYRSFP